MPAGFWKKTIEDKTGDCQLCWIDSEGEPNAIFANDEREFISLLYFDTGFIYDTLKRITRNPAAAPLTRDEIKIYSQSAALVYPNYENFKKFLAGKLDVSMPVHTDMLIKNAYHGNKIVFSYTVNNFH